MSDVPRLGPSDAAEWLRTRGYVYLDVRSEPEFELGHPPGAVNIPVQRVSGDQLVPNPEFVRVVSAHFAPDAALVVGCRSGSRSKAAVRLLTDAGFTNLAELVTGFDGSRDAFGRIEPGWSRVGLDVETISTEEQTYAWRLVRA